MALSDFIPESIRKYIPALKRKEERKQLRTELEALEADLKRKKSNTEDDDANEAVQADEVASDSITEKITHIKSLLSATETPLYARVFKVGLYVAPIVLSYFLAIYLQKSNGLKLIQQELIHPLGTYEMVDSDSVQFMLTEEYQERFWQDFPVYYFAPKGSASVIDKGLFYFDDTASFIETKVILTNSSSNFPLMVSTLQAEVTRVGDAPFPWEKINAIPEIEHTSNGDDLLIRNVGHAPAINPILTYRLSPSDSLVIDYGNPLYGRQNFEEYVVPDLDEYDLMWADPGNNNLEETLYIYHKAGAPKSNVATYEKINQYEFQVIKTVGDLMQVTKVLEVKKIAMKFAYWSVTQEQFTLNWVTKLDTPAIYFIYDESLLSYDEAQYFDPELVIPDQELDGVIDYVDRENVANSLANELYSALGNKPEFRPDGVSLISEKIKVDLLDLPKAAQRSGFKNADQVLNPDGFVIIYLKMYNPGNGRYRVRIKANDEYICEFYVETLIPEESEFVYPQSMIHFKDKKEP